MESSNTINTNTGAPLVSSNPGTPKSVHNRNRPTTQIERIAMPYDTDKEGNILITDKTVAIKLINMYTNALNRGIDCTLSHKRVKQLMKQKKCFYTGIPFEPSGRFVRSIDRVNNDKGYTDENTIACTSISNALKNDLGLKHLERMVKLIRKHS